MFSDYLYRLNRRYYRDPAVVENYAGFTDLLPAERTILSFLDGELRHSRILDVGVGAGRTTGHLRPFAKLYLGLDYSAPMLARCRRTHRGAALMLCDARRVGLASSSFDVVFYSWNGIDEVDQPDRLRILEEIARLLRAGGTFVFSTHNLDAEQVSAFALPRLTLSSEFARSMRESAVAAAVYWRGIANRLRMKRKEVHATTHSIINDHACSFSLLTYYISKEQQSRQLAEAGFLDIEMVRPDGSMLTADEECRDPWIYYIARKG